MKILYLIICLIVSCQLFAQEPAVRSRNYLQGKFRTGAKPTQQDYWDWQESYIHKTEDDITGDAPFDGNRPITSEGFPSVTPGGETVTEFLNNLFYAARKPTATLSAATSVFERMSSGADISVTLNYSITRPMGCPAITSLIIDGTAVTVPVIAEGGSVSSSVSRPLPRNSNKTFSLSVEAGQLSATASTTVNWRYARYWGALDKNTGITDADILALTGAGVGNGKELNETKAKAYNNINGAGKYLVFVYLSTLGEPKFIVNGLTSTAFTKVRDDNFTNAQGAVYKVQVWVTNTRYNSAVAEFRTE